ncbi:MAG: hypothetical protein AB7V16_12690 [Vulcanibacillus sp.]
MMKKIHLSVLTLLLFLLIFTVGCSAKESVNPINEQNTNSIESSINNDEDIIQEENNTTEELTTSQDAIAEIDSNKSDKTTNSTDNDVILASQLANLFYDLQAINKYYDDNLTAMAKVKLDTSNLVFNSDDSLLAYIKSFLDNQFPIIYAQDYTSNVPQEFMQPLSPQGTIPAPAGACPAAAKPTVSFVTTGGKTVTPQLISEKNIRTLPSEIVTIDQNDPSSLVSIIENMVKVGDQSLVTPEGWNTMLWNKLKSMQTSATSMMDYQLWNASKDIEQEVATLYLQRLQEMNVPTMVIDAYNKSNKTGWFASSQPTKEDALSSMNIEAIMTGSLNGTVYEKRNFSISGAGKTPNFGPQTGEGTVVWNHPDLGLMTFEVDILLDKFDSIGRAIGGTVKAVDNKNNYEILFIFKTDGSKEGKLYKDGIYIGQLNMTTNAEKFENYVDIKTNQATSLPNQ